MTIFHGLTESLLFVVERWNKNQNVQQEILFHKCFYRFELRLQVFDLWSRYGTLLLPHTKSVFWERSRSVICSLSVNNKFAETWLLKKPDNWPHDSHVTVMWCLMYPNGTLFFFLQNKCQKWMQRQKIWYKCLL